MGWLEQGVALKNDRMPFEAFGWRDGKLPGSVQLAHCFVEGEVVMVDVPVQLPRVLLRLQPAGFIKSDKAAGDVTELKL